MNHDNENNDTNNNTNTNNNKHHHNKNDNSGIFILSHVPRACYNDNNPPEAIDNLEQYIIDQAKDHYGLQLITVIRPPKPSSSSSNTCDDCEEEAKELDKSKTLLDTNIGIGSFVGSAILIFEKI